MMQCGFNCYARRIEKANRINKAINHYSDRDEENKRGSGIRKEWRLRELMIFSVSVIIPDFMNIATASGGNVYWQFKEGNCFAYKGMKRIGAIDNMNAGLSAFMLVR
jgi:hypothetical protein